uniref:Alpha/beta hydrolase fold-3 domain-containing protein n=1 Tax=Tetradesmus obliquus TaxID=3088 RepID=A0A383W8B7_TETOB|eukprot:jgi/Sobl393_1/2802/SZX73885.1
MASQQARHFLSNASAAGQNGFIGGRLSNNSDISVLRQLLYNFSINGSVAAQREHLRESRNESIAGVPVVFGMPKGVNASSSVGDTRLLVYLHGGGYVSGSCHSQWSTVAPTAAAAGLAILCVEYRLAPEHPFPAGLNDVLSVFKDLLQQGYKGSNIVLLGDSAGGGLVAAVAIALQREGVALPAALGMFSPWAELGRRGQLDTAATLAGVDPILPGSLSDSSKSSSFDMGMRYVGGDTSLFADPLVSPVRADYAANFPAGKLPPVLLQVGLREVLLSDAVLLYHKMKEAAQGPGHVLMSPYDAMWHVFQAVNELPEAQAAAKEMGAFFAAALSGKACPA